MEVTRTVLRLECEKEYLVKYKRFGENEAGFAEVVRHSPLCPRLHVRSGGKESDNRAWAPDKISRTHTPAP